MSLIGKGSTSLRRKDVKEQKSIGLGFKKIRFAHKAALGDTGINLTSLTQPTEMTANGFTNPSATDMAKAQINLFRNNLKLVSSIKGLLVDQLSYTVASSTQINFIDFTAEDGEIFTGWLDDIPTTSLNAVDGKTIVASGTLTAGQTDFNIGTPITINQNSSTQIGAVMVFVDRGLQYRKVGNSSSGDGDYIEVPVSGGLGSLIRFDASGVDRFITVVSNGVVAERPDGSMTAMIERVQGQVDQIVPTLAAVTGLPTTTWQTAPNDVDLKQFGDTVLAQQVIIDALLDAEVPIVTSWNTSWTPTGSWTTNTNYTGRWRRVGDVKEYQVLVSTTGAPNAVTLTVNLPSGDVIDTGKITPGPGYDTTSFGTAIAVDAGVQNYSAINVGYNSTTSVIPMSALASGSFVNSTFIGATTPFTFGSGDTVYLEFKVPIVGLSATQTLREQLGL